MCSREAPVVEWLRLDTGIFDHPKIQALAEVDQLRWLKVLCWCGKHETGGSISTRDARLLLGYARRVDALAFLRRCSAKSLLHAPESLPDIWRVHDWDHYQPDAETLRHKRDLRAKRNRRYRDHLRKRDASQPASRDASRVGHDTEGISYEIPSASRETPPDPSGGRASRLDELRAKPSWQLTAEEGAELDAANRAEYERR